MYIKMLGSLMVLGASAWTGFWLGDRYYQRVAMLRQWRKTLCFIEGEVRYCQVPLAEVFARVGKRSGKNCGPWMLWLSEELEQYEGKSFCRIWEDGVRKYLEHTALKASDLDQIMELGNQLGFLDTKMQEGLLCQAIRQLDYDILELERTLSQKQRVSRLLGISAGIFCVVMFL